MPEPLPLPDDQDPAPRPAPPSEIIPAFAPVPRAAERSNGWKPEVQRAFIAALAETGSVRAACAQVNRADHGAYMLRRHPEAEEFRRAWDAALDIGMRRIEDVAMDRALHGHEQPVYSYGKLIGTRTVYNDRLLMFMLRNRAPERFGGALRQSSGASGASGPNAIDRMELTRLRAKWRKEWEKDRAIDDGKRGQDGGDALVEVIAARHVCWWTGLGPGAKAAYRAFRRIESEEAAIARLGGADEGGALDEDAIDAALADYEETFADDGRAKIDQLIESDGLADDQILGDDLPAPPQNRIITLKGGWTVFDPANNDGRAKPWP